MFVLACVVPALVAILTKMGLETNEVFSNSTVMLITLLVFVLLASPVVIVWQLYYVYAYKSHSKPFKEDFNNNAVFIKYNCVGVSPSTTKH